MPAAIVVFDIDGVVRDVAGSYRRAIADTVNQFTQGQYCPTLEDIDLLKQEGIWNNDWKASQELIYRYFEAQNRPRESVALDYDQLVTFFQSRYRGENFTGYIQNEPLLMSTVYLEGLTQADIAWGFFSGATRGSAQYVLSQRMGLVNPILVAMEDAPSKPDPTGLIATINQLVSVPESEPALGATPEIPIFYVGDTVADLQTVAQARQQYPSWQWVGVGVIPPHVQDRAAYGQRLQRVGAIAVLDQVEALTPELIFSLGSA
ncbi:TIGR01548 family HAD-type hydrolase [Synechococcales cyanobacterium C]|uniref:TIGR01548 family HAD-type hydrolase n=1 Tax=Petrachloros mirabilis ULC683 TaxID=2781853 RepID=A0A8K1ZYX1_9CYAN|nr:TIGR01548 family HAD-type hydrolase [Petrachloros mirabilis]NCJ07368.1 TIGR01548 family HAD-type hydrolase [Petrachloros mirabilis ULC683]